MVEKMNHEGRSDAERAEEQLERAQALIETQDKQNVQSGFAILNSLGNFYATFFITFPSF